MMAKPAIKRIDSYQNIVEKLMQEIEAGTAPWQRPWVYGIQNRPYNAASGTLYRGINFMMLAWTALTAGYADPRWMTFNQASARGYRIKKGEKGSPVIYYCPGDGDSIRTKVDLENPEEVTEEIKKSTSSRAVLRCSYVFNARQIDGIPELKASKNPNLNIYNENAELVLRHSGAQIEHRHQGEAYYSFAKDMIVLPLKEQFKSEPGYYQTALHELSHWTGHPTRLNRKLSGDMISPAYAAEELRAEISSYLLSMTTGVGTDQRLGADRQAAYIAAWLRHGTREERKRELMKAISDAGKIHDFLVQGIEKELGIVPETTPEMTAEQRRNLDAAKAVYPAREYTATGKVIGVDAERNVCVLAVAHKNYCLEYPLARLDRTPEVGEFDRFHADPGTQTWTIEHYEKSKRQNTEWER